MLYNWLIAQDVSEVGISWLDFFSIGHICMGLGIFLLFSLFYTIPMSKSNGSAQVKLPLWCAWIITIVMAIIWELIENILLYDLGLKFEGRRDSTANIITDIILVGMGGLGMWIFGHLVFKYHKKVWPYYVFGIIGLALWIGVFLILRYFTL
ncbi:MAG: hypothetical protein KGD63_07300 [Candidatus Lokiarchaeota archaeon]|nr:hypothetical protein [Candidatus Lokiarchaeota archaeon]